MSIVVRSENVTQVVDRDPALLGNIVALQNLEGIEHIHAVSDDTGNGVRHLNDAGNSPGIETKHDAVMRDQRSVAENVQFQAASHRWWLPHHETSSVVTTEQFGGGTGGSIGDQ